MPQGTSKRFTGLILILALHGARDHRPDEPMIAVCFGNPEASQPNETSVLTDYGLPPESTRNADTLGGALSGEPKGGKPSAIFSIAVRAVSSFARM
jgi:hypothetical protein